MSLLHQLHAAPIAMPKRTAARTLRVRPDVEEHALAGNRMHEVRSESTADLDCEVALLAEGAWLGLGHSRIVA